MTSNEDAETGYKALKRGSPTPLYYPLGVTIRVVALTNTSYGHHGEMALPEVTLGPAP